LDNKKRRKQPSLPESVWEAIFDSIPDLVSVIDKKCNIVRVNKAMAERMGMSEESVIGQHCYQSIHGLPHPHEGCPHVALLKDGQGHACEMFEPVLNGVFLVSTTPVYDKDGEMIGSVHIARDITNRKEAEEKLQVYNRELEELNADKDKFFSVIAHDLKSPFQGLLGFTDLLLDDFEVLEQDEIKQYLLNIRNAAHNTYDLLENLLEWSRMQSGRIQFQKVGFNFSHKITDVLEILNTNASRKGITLVNRIQEGIEVEGDENMLKSVVQNLVSNAIKFSHPRSQVVLTSEIIPGQSHQKDSDTNEENQYVTIHVRDFGVGISPEALKQIFSLTSHHTTMGTANEPGTGLGLVICKEMIELHGGELSVKSTPGDGSVFSFTLPLSGQ